MSRWTKPTLTSFEEFCVGNTTDVLIENNENTIIASQFLNHFVIGRYYFKASTNLTAATVEIIV